MSSDSYKKYVEMITDKNVIIVGPASCLIEDCKNINVDDYDLVCRLNYHWKKLPSEDVVGKRTDIIYHCLNSNQYTVDDLRLWKNDNLTVLSHHDMDHHVDHKKTKIYQNRNSDIEFKILCVPHSLFVKFKKEFSSNPNTGTMAIIHLLSMPIRSLSVVGFDFYSSLYWFDGNPSLLNIIHGMPHKPRIQFANFKKYIKDFDNFVPIGRLKEMLEMQ